MPSPRRVLSSTDVRSFVDEQCFPTGAGRGVGVELEWLAFDAVDGRRASLRRILPAVEALVFPGASRLTVEPGGQVELSSPPERALARCSSALEADISLLRASLGEAGITLVGAGIDAHNVPARLSDSPRYRAMEAFYDGGGEQARRAGRTMMCNTAAIQINVDAVRPHHSRTRDTGHSGDREARWQLAHALGPVLAASFANSPVALGRPTGWRSSRLAAWQGIDPTRTAPALGPGGCVDDWVTYALGARVMMIADGPSTYSPVTNGLSFGRWLEEGHPLGWPTIDDFSYHLTTLFPPVRPKGWLELRMIDALPDPWWRAALGVSVALLDDPEAAAGAVRATAPAAGRWASAARWGLADPVLARAAGRCFQLALGALGRLGADEQTIEATAEYADRYVARGRCPADDEVLIGVPA